MEILNNIGRGIKSLVNWLAEKPSRQYTLPELAGSKNLSLPFNRAARLAERLTTLPGVTIGAFIVASSAVGAIIAPNAAAVGLAGGMFFMGVSKLSGLFNGAVAHVIAKGAQVLVNAASSSPAPEQTK